MNKDWVLFHLKEALEEIENTIKDIEKDLEYEYGDYSEEEAEESSKNKFSEWRQFPTDIDMSC